MIENLLQFVIKTSFWIITFLPTWCTHIQNNITPATSQNCIWHPLTNKFYCLQCRCYSVVLKQWCSQLMIFVSFYIGKLYSSFCHLTSCTTNKSILFLPKSLATVVSYPDLYRPLTFHVPNLMSLFHCVDCTKGSIQARGNYICFVTRPVFGVRSY